MKTRMPDVTIRLNAAEDLAAAGESASADAFCRAYREAAESLCEGCAEVTVVEVTHDAGCDAAWAQEFGLWQAVHDCVVLHGSDWCVSPQAVERSRAALRVWMVRNVPAAAEECDTW